MAESGGADAVKPRAFAQKLNVILVLVFLDCVCNGFVEHLWGDANQTASVILCILSMLVHLMMMIVFFMLLWHTFLIRCGLLLELWSEFYLVILFSLLRFGVLMTARVPRLIAALDSVLPEVYWRSSTAKAAFFLHNIVTVVYDTWLIRRCFGLARVRYFKPQVWQTHRQMTRGRGPLHAVASSFGF